MRFKDIPRNFINFERIYEKALKTIKGNQINTSEFSDIYGQEQVVRDNKEVERLRREFEESNTYEQKEAKKLATIFEAILGEQTELSEWLGSNISTVCATDYDDLKNGIDTITEIDGGSGNTSHMGLAIDATYSSNLSSKFEKIKENIENGRLATVKYFVSPNKDFIGQLRQVPRVVIGADANTINELIELWAENKTKELSEHPIQYQIIHLILIQLESFKDYAKKIGNDELVNKFNGFIKIFVEISDKKMKN